MRLTFPNGEHPAVELGTGELVIGSGVDAQVRVDSTGVHARHARIRADERGVWLHVGDGVGNVHVNARPVLRLAMLRAGDLMCLGHLQVRLCADPVPAAARVGGQPPPMGGVRAVLRGLSGAWSGRSISLGDKLVLGAVPGADVRLDDPALGNTRVEVFFDGPTLRLQAHGDEAPLVNGVATREALLRHGDQVSLDQVRFALEAPGLNLPVRERADEDVIEPDATAAAPRADVASTLWWLIAAACVLAAVITALLLYGPGRGA